MSQIKAMPFVKITGLNPKKGEVNIQSNMNEWESIVGLILTGLGAAINIERKLRNEDKRIISPPPPRILEPS